MDIKSILTPDKFKQMFGNVSTYESTIEACERYSINTPLRIAHFLAQAGHESASLTQFTENLNYSADALLRVFPKYFTPTTANLYARNQQKIASRVYANRLGNGNEASGDGWRYRGRGAIQVTGKANYQSLSKSTGFDFVSNPDLLGSPDHALLSAGWYWDQHKLNSYSDANKLDTISDIVNIGHATDKVGDSNGAADRKDRFNKYIKILGQ